MGQQKLDGSEEGPSRNERLWARLQRMHQDGYYDTKQNAWALLAEGWFGDEWDQQVRLTAAIRAIEACLTDRNPNGTRRAIKTDKVHQYRLNDWATCEEGIWDLQHRLGQYRQDGESIRIDAGNLLRRWPAQRDAILAVLPAELKPFEK